MMTKRIVFPLVVVVVSGCSTGIRSDSASTAIGIPAWHTDGRSTSSSDATCLVVDISRLVRAITDTRLIGCELAVDNVRVDRLTPDGFSVSAAANSVLVVPAEGTLIRVEPGELVDLHGEVRGGRSNHGSGDGGPWVYAYTVRPAWVLK